MRRGDEGRQRVLRGKYQVEAEVPSFAIRFSRNFSRFAFSKQRVSSRCKGFTVCPQPFPFADRQSGSGWSHTACPRSKPVLGSVPRSRSRKASTNPARRRLVSTPCPPLSIPPLSLGGFADGESSTNLIPR